MRFSASRLKQWMNCSLAGHLKYDENLQSLGNNAKGVFGTCIHKALEEYNQGAPVGTAVGTFLDLWTNPEKVGAPTETLVWPRSMTFGGLKERGITVLKDMDDRMKLEQRHVIAVEHPFLVPFGRHELNGVVDLLEVRKSGKGRNLLRIVDYKSASKQPNFGELYLDIQFTVYAYASLQPEFWFGNGPDYPPVTNAEWAYEMFGDLPRRPIWFHLMAHPPKEIDAGPRDDADFMRLYRLADEIERAQAEKVFVPRIGEHCTICDFRDNGCPVTIPTREDVQDDENAWL